MMLGFGSSATVGKDTLFKVLSTILGEEVEIERVALADLLKAEVNDFTTKSYGISAFTKSPVDKEIIRPLFVVHGKIRRIQTKGKYWTNLLQERVNCLKQEKIIPVCTDIRYAEYPEDEIHWLKRINNGVYIHINRYDKNGLKVEPANEEERKNSILLEKEADFTLNWKTSDDFDFLIDTVKIQLGNLLEKIYETKRTAIN